MSALSILAVNGGSSSLKAALFEQRNNTLQGIEKFNLSNSDQEWQGPVEALKVVLAEIASDPGLPQPGVVGHRVVHGGDLYQDAVRVDAEVKHHLQQLVSLAPLHQPVNLQLIETCMKTLPGIPQVACFDTAFHQHMPDVARNYAIPSELTAAGLRAYGFHGLSYQYVWNTLLQQDPAAVERRIIVAHLGAGASLCAIKNGHSIATTMGFSTAMGLPMATRSGNLDPGLIIHLLREHDMNVDDVEELIYRQSGLLALSGQSGDMRQLQNTATPRAQKAIDYFVYRVIEECGRLVAVLGGLDTLVFTGGIGSNDAMIRKAVCTALGWLNLQLDDSANETNAAFISSGESQVETRVMLTNEEAMIAEQAMCIVKKTKAL